ncbi:DUF6683 family protein [Deinococcus sp.]|uniref:DUF6683 family protein n=1 Tax=Deinococcus sp. TaxID=47478 RepID=UPI0025E1E84D|nr:DUF6683 family protein [Deinococcus sp.]
MSTRTVFRFTAPSRALILALLLSAAPASAQAVGGNASSLSSSIFKLMNQVGPAPTTPTKGQTPAPVTQTPAPVIKPAALNFKVSPAVRKKVIDNFVATITEGSPESGAEWNKLFKSSDVFAEIDKQVKTMFGLGTTNLADTWAVYWSYAWLMTRSRTDDPTRAQISGLRNQFQPLLLAIPSVAALNDAQKQEMSDTLLLQVALYGVLAEAWKNDQASRDDFGSGLVSGTKQMGLDLSLVTLTDKGFTVNK